MMSFGLVLPLADMLMFSSKPEQLSVRSAYWPRLVGDIMARERRSCEFRMLFMLASFLFTSL